MKTIIAGSRNFTNYQQMKELMNQVDWWITEVVSGKAPGADSLGEKWAKENGIEINEYPAPWNEIHGKPSSQIGYTKYNKPYWKLAGHARNKLMANNAEALVLFWDGISKGSKNMLENASEKELKIKVFFI